MGEHVTRNVMVGGKPVEVRLKPVSREEAVRRRDERAAEPPADNEQEVE